MSSPAFYIFASFAWNDNEVLINSLQPGSAPATVLRRRQFCVWNSSSFTTVLCPPQFFVWNSSSFITVLLPPQFIVWNGSSFTTVLCFNIFNLQFGSYYVAESFNYRWVPSILDVKVNSVVDLKIVCLLQTINCTLHPPPN